MRVSLNEQSQAEWQSRNLEHLRYEYDLQPSDVVIDIGAYRGEWANEIRRRYGCTPIVVEPTDAIDGYDGEIVKKAAWTHDGTLPFGGAFYYSSHYEQPVTEYQCFDTNTLLERFDNIALIKINIEGAEYDLLDHVIFHGLLPRIDNLQVQFHLVEGEDSESRYRLIAESLSDSHSLTWRYPFCWENWRRT